ncbi:cysteine-rich receptor-like protein kinase 25 [Rosa chinensis]|uniref:cysteine-rich receptor-like protein kinase 25 n=1 Tax=Rosa chinensis TaxID=74649 RepID=UPI001AD8D02E|nr:cysteine-rich receptor-like protein kinase 25 [Rosa chinensis]
MVRVSEICMVQYSPNLIFGTVEKDPVIRADSKNNALNAEAFAQVLNLLLQNLRDRAASGNSSEKFAAGHAPTDEGQTIYALVQCTPDIDKGDCSNCLGSCISDIPSCCDGKEGARILKPSCNIRYEVSRFYKSAVDSVVDVSAPPATPTTPETPAPPKQGKKSNTIKTIIIIIVVVIAFVTMLLGGTCIFLQVKKPWVKLGYDRISQEMSFVNSLQYEFEIIRSATDDFSDANKLGQGGFGDVYKVTKHYIAR